MSLVRSKHILLGVAAICFALGYFLQTRIITPDLVSIANHFEQHLQEKQSEIDKLLNSTYSVDQPASFSSTLVNGEWIATVRSFEGVSILVFENDTLVLWTDNNVPLPKTFLASQTSPGLIQLQNGWYDVRVASHGSTTALGFILIKRQYAFENRFLSNSFLEEYEIPKGCILTTEDKKNSVHVTSTEGAMFGYLSRDESYSSNGVDDLSFTWLMALMFFIGGILGTVMYLKHLVSLLGDHFGKAMVSVVFVVSVIGLRVLMIWNKFPLIIYELPVFSPSFYGTSSIFPSLGDFFLNGLTSCALAYYIQQKLAKDNPNSSAAVTILEFVKLTIVLLISIPVFILIEGLVTNSNISYNINNLFELNYMGFIGLISLGLFTFFYYFITETAVKKLTELSGRTIALISLGSVFTFVLVCAVLDYYDPALILCPPAFVGIIMFKNYRNHITAEGSDSDSRLYPVVALIAVSSVFIAHSISHSHTVKELEQRKILAQKLAVETDPVAEYMYGELEKSLLEDPLIKKAILNVNSPKDSLFEYVNDKHLRGFWEKYDVQTTICQIGDSLVIQEENITVPCRAFFKGMERAQGVRTIAKNLYYLENNNGRVSYLGILEVQDVTFFMEFDSKIIPEELGFPELLLDLEVSEHLRDAMKYYSYAKFKDGKISSQSGGYRFSGNLPVQKFEDDYATLNAEGYSHLFYQVDANTTIILSRKLEHVLDPVFRFSYLFAMLCMLSLAFLGLSEMPLSINSIRMSFRKRIELSMILVLLISLIPIAIGTKYYIEKQYQTRNDQNIREKIQSVLIEIEHKLADEEQITPELQEYIAYLLQKFSYVFFTDINLYNLDGSLIASSRPKMFKEGLTGSRMNARAYKALAADAKHEFIHQEEIGKLSFLSAYALFRNKDQEVLAYLNLPYFAKQDDVKKEVSTFFVALFNIYVVLILIAVVIALIISNRITQPLRLIQEKLSKVKVGMPNEPIEWKSRDEIGNLVDEYNRMLKDLEKSAILLAKSERESAWREMAKQVAHEIKNPLTPMKLSVQHLQRARRDPDIDWEKKLNQFTQTLIQQIDALTNIADEFSNFAKMPKTKNTVVDLGEICLNAIDLFQESGPVDISFDNNASKDKGELLVLADKEQLNQVLNNLIKNAIQAIPESAHGKIDIGIDEKDESYIVSIKDNGTGIKKDEYDKIFAPNFTTKTGGMGLGLALVKTMVENVGGGVWFESSEGTGTTFFFSLPIHQVR
jgi:signal transduction histidine kinase